MRSALTFTIPTRREAVLPVTGLAGQHNAVWGFALVHSGETGKLLTQLLRGQSSVHQRKTMKKYYKIECCYKSRPNDWFDSGFSQMETLEAAKAKLKNELCRIFSFRIVYVEHSETIVHEKK